MWPFPFVLVPLALPFPGTVVLAAGDTTLNVLWGPALAAVVGFPAVWLTYRQATNARKSAEQIDSRKVDAEAYERAQHLMEAGISQLQSQLSRVQAELLERDAEVSQLRTRVRELEDLVYSLRRAASE